MKKFSDFVGIGLVLFFIGMPIVVYLIVKFFLSWYFKV